MQIRRGSELSTSEERGVRSGAPGKVDLVDPELLGVPLDLERPELTSILERYVSRSKTPRSALPGTDRDVVIVAFPGPLQDELAAAFSACGWCVHECAGPPHVACPLTTSDKPCELRSTVDVAVVAIDGDVNLSNGGVALTSCAGCSASTGVIVLLRHREEVIDVEEHTAIIGAGSTPQQIVAVAEYMLPVK
jgi:hypothetical protein